MMTGGTIGRRRIARTGWTIGFLLLAVPPLWAQPRWGRPRVPRSGACFYRDPNFRGEYFCADIGDDISSMPSGMNDEISSIRTFGNAEVEVFQDTRYRGRSERFGASVQNLKQDGWNDKLSSIRITRRGGRDRNSDQRDNDRNSGMARSRAEDIVRRAYQTVLRREPDPASSGFVERVIRDGWTQADVERELRKSEEYRRKRQ
jgi:hypothetical protein